MSKDINNIMFSFREYLRVKNYSPKSIETYTKQLKDFFDYLNEEGIKELKKVTADILEKYQLSLAKKKGSYAVSTISIKLRSVKRLFEYLEKTNQILINPAHDLQEPKRESRLPRIILSKEEVKKILNQPNLSILMGIRDRTILEVFYSTGIRLEEIINLTIYDVDLQGGLLRVNKGKGAKDRVIPLGKHAKHYLKEYLLKIRPVHSRKNKQSRILFVNQRATPLSTQTVQIMVREYAKKAGIKKKVTPHVFRHTFATELVKNGADITAVRKMLGHSDLKTTQVYTKVAGIDVKASHKKHHPREKEKIEKEEIKPSIEKLKGRYGKE